MTGARGRVWGRTVLLALPLLVFVAVALLAGVLAPADPTSTDLSAALRAPDATHWLGTDQLGRDQLSRVVWAARTSMTVATAVLAVALGVGLLLGTAGALLGGAVDRVVTWAVELALSVPALLLALTVLGVRGPGTGSLVLALSLLAWAPYARVARGAVLAYRSGPAYDALTGLGAHPARVLTVHALPAAARPALVLASTDVGAVVLSTATLSFLGLGIAPPTPEWGQMLVESRPYLATAWWLWLPPGLALTAVALSGNLLGEHLALPPELRRWRWRSPRPRRGRRSGTEVGGSPSTGQPEPPTSRGSGRAGAPVLVVRDLRVVHDTPCGTVTAVDGLEYRVRPREVLALVGESGSGKSSALLAPLGLTAPTARVTGSATVAGTELLGAPEAVLRRVRGGQVGVVFQDPATALNPLRTVGSMVGEALRPRVRGAGARARVVDLLRTVGLPEPEQMARCYPHELSGGMRQRVLIAAALAGDPAVLLADEPTTALDVTMQAEVLTLLADLRRSRGLAVVLVSHDLAVVAEVADRVLVLDHGRVVEEGPTGQVVSCPRHPLTRALVEAVPVIGRPVRVTR